MALPKIDRFREARRMDSDFAGRRPLTDRSEDQILADPDDDGDRDYGPDSENFGMEVPEGGSSCEKCEYFDGLDSCNNEDFATFIESDSPATIPAAPDSYCCNAFSAGSADDQENKKP